MTLPSRAISHARDHLRVSRFARRTTEKRETARSLPAKKINPVKSLPYRAFSLSWPTSMQIYWNKRKRLHKKRVQLPQDWFGTTIWPP